MAKLFKRRFIRLPLKLNQIVYYKGFGGELTLGIVRDMDIYFLDSGKEVDIDFWVHPIIDNQESEVVECFSDCEINKTIFTSKRKARRYIKTSR